jgi:hypothetical protein
MVGAFLLLACQLDRPTAGVTRAAACGSWLWLLQMSHNRSCRTQTCRRHNATTSRPYVGLRVGSRKPGAPTAGGWHRLLQGMITMI